MGTWCCCGHGAMVPTPGTHSEEHGREEGRGVAAWSWERCPEVSRGLLAQRAMPLGTGAVSGWPLPLTAQGDQG